MDEKWSPQPVLPRQSFFTKEVRGLPHGGESCSNNPIIHQSITPFAVWSQSQVLPWARRAYETCLSAGSTAVLADGVHCARPTSRTATIANDSLGNFLLAYA
jgi:hypothetical protein